MRRSTARIALALVALTIAGQIPAAADAGRDTAAAPLVIASFVPETGTLMPVLDSLRVPVELAVDEVNAAGGVNGQPVTLLRGDEGDTVATARATFAQLVAQHVDAIEGPAAPATTLGILGAVKKAHVLMCSGSDTLAPVTAHSSDGYFFRTAPPSRLEGYALAELTLSDGHRRVAVLRRDDFFGDELDGTLVSRLRKGGAKIVSDIAYDATATDYAGDAAKVARGKPDAVVVLGFNDDGARVVQSLAGAGIGPSTVGIYAPDTMQSTDFAAKVDPTDPTKVSGIKGAAPAPAPFDVQSPFQDMLKDRGVDAIFSSHYYDCTILTALAAVKAKSNDPTKLRGAFAKNLAGKHDCNTFATCLALLDKGRSIHWRGASSNFDHWSGFEPGEGVYDTWSYDARGVLVTSPPSDQISVP